VGVTVLPGQNGQRDRVQQVGQERRVVAGERQRTSLDPVAEKSGGGQELAEENELAQRRDGGVRIPFDVEATTAGVDGQRWIEHGAGGGSSTGIKHLTLRVSGQRSDLQWHGPFQQPLAKMATQPTAFSKSGYALYSPNCLLLCVEASRAFAHPPDPCL